MAELLTSKSHLVKFHIVSFIIGLSLSLLTFWLVPFSWLSLVENTLTSLKIVCLIVGVGNGVGYFVLASSSVAKHKTFSVISLPLAVISAILLTYVAVVVFGAPFLTKVSETFHLACLLASCSVIPFIFACQRDWDVWIKILFLIKQRINIFEWNIFFCTFSPVVGCLLGAAFIPLDWDRPWQTWPITCCVGCLAGFTLAHLFCLIRISSFFSSKLGKWKIHLK